MEGTSSPFDFLRMIEGLKNTPRKGWAIRGIPFPESVSDHMYRMAVMVLMIPEIDEEVRRRAVYMALVHDIGEAITGDIVPSDGVSKEEKFLKERLAVSYLTCLLGPANQTFADQLMELWLEYEKGDSKAAQLVRSVDALECMHQAVIYEERSGLGRDLSEFMALDSKVNAPELRDWTVHLLEERGQIWTVHEATDVRILFVLGGPGVGKGTQCAQIVRDYASVHVSVGDLLREEAKSPTSRFANFINDSMKNSVVIPADLSIWLIQKKMTELQLKSKCIVAVDGFPRSLDQARAFEAKISRRYFTILLDCPEEVQLQRLESRAKSSGRIDDNDDSIKKRLRTFLDDNQEIEDYLRSKGQFWTVDASGSIDTVNASVGKVIEEITADWKEDATPVDPGSAETRTQ